MPINDPANERRREVHAEVASGADDRCLSLRQAQPRAELGGIRRVNVVCSAR